MEIKQLLARNVRRRRSELGLSQEDLADAASIDRTYVSGIERGLRNPTLIILERLANALGVQAFTLIQK